MVLPSFNQPAQTKVCVLHALKCKTPSFVLMHVKART